MSTSNAIRKNQKSHRRAQTSDPVSSLGKLASVVSFGLFVIILIQYVDARYSRESESQMEHVLASREEENQQKLSIYETDAKDLLAELEQFQEDTITFDELERVQDEFLLLAKKHDCTLKKASPNEKQTIAFLTGSKNGQENSSTNAAESIEEVEFETPRCGLTLSLAGDLESVLAFVKAVREKPWITSTSQLTLRRDSSAAGVMSLEMEITFYSLQRKPSAQQSGSLPQT